MVNQNERLSIEDCIKAKAYNLGFCLCGITNSAVLESFEVYKQWINSGFQGEMSYMASDRHLSVRQAPTLLAPWVKSIVVFGWPYSLNRATAMEQSGQIAGYVGEIDYHLLLPQKIQHLVDELPQIAGEEIRAEIYCDSAPILERELAARAGLGWIGRNSCLISPKHGSAILLAELFLDLELTPDPPFEKDLCGSCHRCLQACPTSCILPERVIDAGKCVSTLTIENKDLIPSSKTEKVANHLFGCDICQAVCPWNHRIKAQSDRLAQVSEVEMITELTLSEDEFRSQYAQSAIQRVKRRGWIRNLCVVLANMNSLEAFDPLSQVFAEDKDPLCRIAAAKALVSLNQQRAGEIIQKRLQSETEATVTAAIAQIIKENSLQ
jgi:epoxyqueuosine reductase